MGTRKRRAGAGGVVTAIGVVFAGGAAIAQAVSLTANISERLTFTDNFALQNSSAGTTISSVTNFALNFRTRTATSDLSMYAASDLVYRDDPAGSTSVDGFNPNFRVDYTRTGQALTFNIGANYSDAPINFQTAPPGVIPPPGGTLPPLITSTATRRNYGLSTGLNYQINANDTLNGNLRFSATDYDASATGLFDFSGSVASLTWSRAVNSRLTGSIDGNYGVFFSDDPLNDKTRAAGFGVSATWDQTNTVSMDGRLAIGYSIQDSPTGSSESTNFLGNIGITYQMPTGSVSATVGQGYAPGATGELLLSSFIRVSGSYDVNSTSRMGLVMDYNVDETVFSGSSSKVLTLSPIYSIDLTSSVTASTGYTFTNAKFGGNSANSHEVFFFLNKNFDLLP